MAEFENIKLNDIKSSDIKKEIFSFLDVKQKLKMIVYSKELQKMLCIGIKDYKKIKGICKIGEKNGEGKEYIVDTNILIFEGKYSNGRRNGKGKEYYKNNKLKFEGEYLNGKKWSGIGYNVNGKKEFEIKDGIGNIKEYNDNGELIFEGEYKNGERNGKGKEYFKNGKIIFEGEYLDGRKNGKGKVYNEYSSKLIYEGEFLNGERTGKGKEYNHYGELIF